MRNSPVKVTGTGCICSAGRNLDECASSIYAGRRAPRLPSMISAELEKTYPVFEVDDIPDNSLFPNFEISRTNRLLLNALSEALDSAMISSADLKTLRVGVALGTTVGCTLNNEKFYRDFLAAKKPSLGPVLKYLDNNPARLVSEILGLNGPSVCLVNACASGTDAVGLAASWIRNGICDIAIAGGADELSRISYLGFISLMISSTEACRPFDRKRNGLNLGEGAAVLILESPESKRRKLAEISAYATDSDAYHATRPHPEGRGLKTAIMTALDMASLKASDIGFVNAHGTATPDNDRTEGRALSAIFGTDLKLVATKAYTGHTLGAAGAIEAVLTVKALSEGMLSPAAGFDEADEECVLAPLIKKTGTDARYGLSTSLAFGGVNSCLIIGRGDL